ncbi:hypothetical protein [Saccharibacillus alkalitolerans]|uniref:Copper amine oxidase-like N-terminal domain-containing protein n=1 Tax=Saccharibacillus alkalitolerans TaxID=2705290 RepID=A0ABX0EYX7_9BACL|nr:hypothetical protein [Saccharibacillus alkalitolerans]NGZ73942.1 hypothetical protein [Saccharibacillus alkalitolerans]
MRKKALVVLLGTTLLAGLGSPAYAANVPRTVAERSYASVVMDGEVAPVDGYTIANNTYYRLRDVAALFNGTPSQFQVTWNERRRKVEILTGQPYVPAAADKKTNAYRPYARKMDADILIDGSPLRVQAYQIEGSTYFKLRDLAELTQFRLKYDAEQNEIRLSPRPPEGAYELDRAYPTPNNQETADFQRWKRPIHSNLLLNPDGTTGIVTGNDELASLTIETYTADHKLQGSRKIAYELPLFGGFYSGETYQYAVFGQKNEEENDAKEVIRIVRYDKEFKRIGSVSITGGASYTVIPFNAGSLRMAEQGNTLVVHTARKRYTTPDSLNHQSQLTILVDTSAMSVTNDLGRFQKNHVSHSFDQYAAFDGGEHVLVDHGDAYPRSIVLQKGDGASYQEVELFHIPGPTGANATGVSIGGFEVTPSGYLTAWNSVDHSKVKSYTSYEMAGLELDQRDIMLSVLPKGNMTESAVRQIKLAAYSGQSRLASVPKLVKLSEDRYMVLWQEYDLEGRPGDLKFVRVDGQGQTAGPIRSLPYYRLGETQPVLAGDRVIWSVDQEAGRVLYTLPASE